MANLEQRRRTVEETKKEIKHDIPIGTLVEVKYDEFLTTCTGVTGIFCMNRGKLR